MSNDTGTAFLVDPMGSAPEKLSHAEYQVIRSMLDITRDKNLRTTAEVMNWMISSASRQLGTDALLLSIIWHYVNYEAQDRCPQGEVDGVLAGHHQKHSVHWITEEERKTLEQTLAAIRCDFWFAEWLSLQVDSIASANHPDDRFPSPLKIAATLTDCIVEYEEKMETAREMVRMHPNLLSPAASEPPRAVEPNHPQPATKQPAKPQRARKPQKKSHAKEAA